MKLFLVKTVVEENSPEHWKQIGHAFNGQGGYGYIPVFDNLETLKACHPGVEFTEIEYDPNAPKGSGKMIVLSTK